MDRFTSTFEALLTALADTVKQLGDGSQPRWARTRVEEAKQDFIACCDIMCFQLKQAVEMIRAEMLQASSTMAQNQTASWDNEQVQQLLEAAERFAAQLGDPVAAAAGAAAAPPDAAPGPQNGGGAGVGSDGGRGGGLAAAPGDAEPAPGLLPGVNHPQPQYMTSVSPAMTYGDAAAQQAVAPVVAAPGMAVVAPPIGDVQVAGQLGPGQFMSMAGQVPGIPMAYTQQQQVYPGQNVVFKMET